METAKYDVIIIGAGASGLMCAAALYNNDPSLKVLVLEKNSKPGRKLLATGNGRCNFTNLDISSDSYNTDDVKRLIQILHAYPANKIIDYFEKKIGVIAAYKDDLVYPITYQSKTIADALMGRSKSARFVYDTKVTSIVKKQMGYVVNGIFEADDIVIACGGVSYPDTGSDGSMYPVLKELAGASSFERLLPSLVPLKTSDRDVKSLAGLRQECTVTMDSYVQKGEIQFTDYGISGICVMQLSGIYNRAAAAGKNIKYVSVDLIPSMDQKTKEQKIKELLESFPDKSAVDALGGLLKKQIAKVVIDRSDKSASDIARITGDFRINLSGSMGFENAQVTSGGVKLGSLNDGLELLNHKGIYVIGEAVNVDGLCGGYNLHWAWASALTASEAILEESEGL
ncbi:MAG: aminoacetone oxidase family FAD-binding enzyme [Clostridiales bacterium]|nr:aminoacetone oxidase family FAD-binding enzyme [Clostridiales bacterium]